MPVRNEEEEKKKKQQEIAPVPVTEESVRGIRFNPDKTVDIVERGPTGEFSAPTRLSKAEYADFQSRGGGKRRGTSEDLLQTPEQKRVNDLVKRFFTLRQARLMQQQGRLQSLQSKGQLTQNISDVNIPENLPELNLPKTQEEKTLTTKEQFLQDTEGATDIPSKINRFAAEKLGAGSGVELRKEFTAKLAKSAAQIIDGISSLWSARKQADVVANEASFNDAKALIDADINDYKAGLISEQEMLRNIVLAQEAIDRLEGSAKGFGKANLRFWLTGGKELEVQIVSEKQQLERFKIKAQMAILEQQMISQQEQQLTKELNQAMEGL